MTEFSGIPSVVAVSKSQKHNFSKSNCDSITLLTGLGVDGDAHLGKTVKHRSRVKVDPTKPNLRQVHLISIELIETLKNQGFRVERGIMGENITTANLDLLSLPTGTILKIGTDAIIQITGLRNPCKQLDNFQDGLMSAVLDRSSSGELIRKAGVMGIVLAGGQVKPEDTISVQLPDKPHEPLKPV